MKHSVSAAAIALALGFGLATVAQAHGSYSNSATANPTMQQSAAIGHAKTVRAKRHVRVSKRMSRERVMQLQRRLKSAGLYKGRIDGVMGRRTRLALSRFHKERGTSFARTNRGRRAVGVGSSMPNPGATMPNNPNNNTGTNPNLGATSTPQPSPGTPPSNQNMTGAGGSNATQTPNQTK